jgi:membrane associated rhomboid family serine protease
MIIPWGTDAPLYHRPIATVGLIVVNVFVYLMFPTALYQDWTLVLGDGIHPAQWVTNLFLHSGIWHVAGNMIFLWTFGFVVEGKLGWWAFMLVYLGLGIVESAGMQLLMHTVEPTHLLGSSGVVFGLLAMCLVWAPKNEVVCILWLRFTPTVFDAPIVLFAAGYIALDVLTSGLTGVLMANVTNRSLGAILAIVLDHSVGALLGFVVAVVLLKCKWVDCENWDLFAVMEGRQGKSKAAAGRAKARTHLVSAEYRDSKALKSKKKGKKVKVPVSSIEDAAAVALRTMRRHLELGEFEAAVAVYQKSSRSLAGWHPEESDWVNLIQAVLDHNAWSDAALIMRDYLKRSPTPSPRIRLKFAQVLIQRLSRPTLALSVLEQIAEGSLPQMLEATRQKLVRQAEQMREDGELELQDEMW